MSKYLTTPVVDAISAAKIYVDPAVWSKIIINPVGQKPNWLAIHLFGRILYWYTRTEVRDEVTGRFLGYKKKFKYHMLQMSYQSIMEQMGCTYKEARCALDCLLSAKLIINPKEHHNGLGNLMFIEPVVSNILCIINPEGVHNDTPLPLEVQTPLPLEVQSSAPGGTESTLCSTSYSKTLNTSYDLKGSPSVDNPGGLPTSGTPLQQTEDFKKSKELLANRKKIAALLRQTVNNLSITKGKANEKF